jgi:signal transduction histidine kinase/ActR/RegA family two-component response regulator
MTAPLPDASFREAVLALPGPVAILDREGVIVFCNAAWEQLGRDNGDPSLRITGVGASYLKALRWASGEEMSGAAGVQGVLSGSRGPYEFDFPSHAPPEPRFFRCRVTPLEHGGAVAWHQDVTERKKFEAQLREQGEGVRRLSQLLSAAQEANRMKDEFLATLSHELRPPLNAIVGWAHLLRKGGMDEEAASRALDAIKRNADVQTRLIGDIVDISSIVAGKLHLDFAPVELPAVIEAAVDTAGPAAEAKGVRLQAVLDRSVGSVRGDADRLRQVFWNLLSNAIKFTPQGGRIRVRLARSASQAEVSVEDSGSGVGRETVPNVFTRLRPDDVVGTRTPAGLGLGLAIVRHLVELHGGTIEVDARASGYMTGFVVKLPLLAIPAAPPASALTREPAGQEPVLPGLKGLRVLLVDDEEDSREVIARILEQQGAEVVPVGSAGDALRALDEALPDVLLSDIGMPGEDGYSLVRKMRLRSPEKGGLVPAAALTAFARSEDRMQALLAGFQLHLPKPVQPDELVAVVSSLAGRTRPAGHS